jgi:hypothetical protein
LPSIVFLSYLLPSVFKTFEFPFHLLCKWATKSWNDFVQHYYILFFHPYLVHPLSECCHILTIQDYLVQYIYPLTAVSRELFHLSMIILPGQDLNPNVVKTCRLFCKYNTMPYLNECLLKRHKAVVLSLLRTIFISSFSFSFWNLFDYPIKSYIESLFSYESYITVGMIYI